MELCTGYDIRFEQHYQPIIDMQSLEVDQHEALLRGKGSAIDTQKIISLMEKTGEIIELDLWSIETALKAVAGKGCSIAVNVSSVSISSRTFCRAVEFLLMVYAADSRILFEVTETAPIHDPATASDFSSMARGFGCLVGLDDFGSGHATLDVAKGLKLDYIKLSSALTTAIGASSGAEKQVYQATKMARDLGLFVVGEHIERYEQYDWLRDAGVGFGQGWLFAKASPDIDLTRNFKAEVEQAKSVMSKPAFIFEMMG